MHAGVGVGTDVGLHAEVPLGLAHPVSQTQWQNAHKQGGPMQKLFDFIHRVNSVLLGMFAADKEIVAIPTQGSAH